MSVNLKFLIYPSPSLTFGNHKFVTNVCEFPSVLSTSSIVLGFPGVSDSKESPCNAGDLGWEDPLEEGMATQSSILAWRIPWTEDLVGLQSMASQRVEHD